MPRASRPRRTVITSSTNPHDAVLLEIGTRSKHERAEYPDVDLLVIRDDKGSRYTHKNGGRTLNR
jgi:uncharacterized cupin superfamily protein